LFLAVMAAAPGLPASAGQCTDEIAKIEGTTGGTFAGGPIVGRAPGPSGPSGVAAGAGGGDATARPPAAAETGAPSARLPGDATTDPGGKGAMDSEEPSAPDPVAKADDPAVTAERRARLAEAKRLDGQGLEIECMDLVHQIRD
jgi:hypothetical protein